MIKIVFLTLLFSVSAQAYVPTVESLFRNGSNPDITSNALSITMVVKKAHPGGVEKLTGALQDVSLVKEQKTDDFFKIFYTKSGETLKIAQSRYDNASFSATSLKHKIYYPNFTPYTIRSDIEKLEKGVFFGLLNSLALNDGSFLLNYLKSTGIPVRLNNELINREKVELLANYKSYLVTINKDRQARKTDSNPLRPDDSSSRERVERIMNESMYIDTKQVKLSRDNGELAWIVTAGNFEAVISYKNRLVQKIKYKSLAGEFEIQCRDYWLANGMHLMPRYMLIKTLNGENYKIEITNLRHYTEKEDDLIKRLKTWDELLRGKESTDPRPEFLL